MMKVELKAKWLAALRSGDYKQGKGALKSQDLFLNQYHCCLGVLCEVAEIPNELEEEQGYFTFIDNTEQIDTGFLPLGFSDEVGFDYEVQKPLAEMNDRGTSFESIADYIEQNL